MLGYSHCILIFFTKRLSCSIISLNSRWNFTVLILISSLILAYIQACHKTQLYARFFYHDKQLLIVFVILIQFPLLCFSNFQQFTLRANMPDCMLFPKTSSNRDTKFLSRVTKNLPLSSHWQARTCTKSSWKNTSLSSMTTIRKYRQRNCSNRLKKSWETPENIPASASKIQTTRVDITNVHQISRTTAKNRGRVLLVHLQISQKRRQALQVK